VGHRPRDGADGLWLGSLVVGTWPLVLAASGPDIPLIGIVARVAGMLAGYVVLVLLILMARTPALEQGVGADVLARWHSVASRIVVPIVRVHSVGATAAWAQLTGAGALLGTGVAKVTGTSSTTSGHSATAFAVLQGPRAGRASPWPGAMLADGPRWPARRS
jgi:hypothetical protein